MQLQDQLDPAAILAELGVSGAAEIAPVAGGADTALWRVAHAGQTYALRVFRREQAAVCRRELAAMHAAAAAGLPVPSVHASGAWQERPALLLGWCAGEPLIHALLRRPWRIWPLGGAFGRMQATIHAIAPSADPELPPDTWIDWAGTNDQALLAGLRAIPSTRRLLHLDYHPLNVLTDGRRITAVLDWANARIGDPRADLARSYSILAIEPGWPRGLHVRIFRWVLARAWQRGYEQAGGQLDDMALFYAWAGALMARELEQRAARPAASIGPRQIDAVRRWATGWKQRAGIK